MDDADRYKRDAADYAVRFLRPGMIVGLGHGSTAAQAVERIAACRRDGALTGIRGIPCSTQVEAHARARGIPLTTLEAHPVIDVTLDGADEVDPELGLIKGGGGALLREKVVAQATRREIILVDASKLSPRLGTRAAVPVAVLPFGWRTQLRFLEGLGARCALRSRPDGAPFVTDDGHFILDARFGPLDDPAALACQLQSRAGIAAHGLFLGLADTVVAAGPEGVRELRRTR